MSSACERVCIYELSGTPFFSCPAPILPPCRKLLSQDETDLLLITRRASLRLEQTERANQVARDPTIPVHLIPHPCPNGPAQPLHLRLCMSFSRSSTWTFLSTCKEWARHWVKLSQMGMIKQVVWFMSSLNKCFLC